MGGLGAALLALLAAACGGGDGGHVAGPAATVAGDGGPGAGGASSPPVAATVTSVATPVQVTAKDFVIREPRKADIMAAASDFERPLLADGVLTFAEYEQSLFAGWECMEAEGMHPEGLVPRVTEGMAVMVPDPSPRLTARGRYIYTISYGPLGIGQGQAVQQRCSSEYSALVEFMWAENIAPTEAEQQAPRTHGKMHDRTGVPGEGAPF